MLLNGAMDETGGSGAESKPGPEQREKADLGPGFQLVTRLVQQSLKQSLGRLHSFLVGCPDIEVRR